MGGPWDEFKAATHDIAGATKDIARNIDYEVNGYESGYIRIGDALVPIAAVVGVLIAAAVLLCLMIYCCCCRSERGRVIVSPPPVPMGPQIVVQHTYPGTAAGTHLYGMVPTYGRHPVVTPNNTGITQMITPVQSHTGVIPSAGIAKEYPPTYDTDRLLHTDAK